MTKLGQGEVKTRYTNKKQKPIYSSTVIKREKEKDILCLKESVIYKETGHHS